MHVSWCAVRRLPCRLKLQSELCRGFRPLQFEVLRGCHHDNAPVWMSCQVAQHGRQRKRGLPRAWGCDRKEVARCRLFELFKRESLPIPQFERTPQPYDLPYRIWLWDRAPAGATVGPTTGRHQVAWSKMSGEHRTCRLRRHTNWRLSRRTSITLAVIVVVSLAMPVPWLHAVSDDPPGWAWRLDGRLVVDGEVVDPAGRWLWLTVGRPPLTGELVRDAAFGTTTPPRDMRSAPPGTQPQMVEPVAAAVGLIHAGADLQLGLFVEGLGPTLPGYPEHAVVVAINDVALNERQDWGAAIAEHAEVLRFQTVDGQWWTAPGPSLPYAHVRVVDLGPELLDASIGGRIAEFAPVDWFRSLSLGYSHGLMVALVTYADAVALSVPENARIAGTGGVLGDGSVARISGLRAKAVAARRAGAHVLFYPASQTEELERFDAAEMELVPVQTLADAITWLEGRWPTA